ncbi:MAG TPA: hypothetical protein VGN18_00590 [Jatrophihabitans sp.]|jgi:hypothetical protein|uniref:hypothetical protein n=1 Tax=Jatrophihabitans sp. TaxID=1932789 RepID=UPI002E04E273|nr:hypothetical protein [Jatrophihabitans sp.]
MTATQSRRRRRDETPDTHQFPTRPYDLVREFVIALGVVVVLTVGLAAVFSSPDRKAITLQDWARVAPNDVVATATAELAGTSTSASYGAPYNNASEGQKIGPLALQKLGGVQTPVDSANDLVIHPLQTVSGDATLTAALTTWTAAPDATRTGWATAYSEALAAVPDGDPGKVKAGDYGPVPTLATQFRTLAARGGLETLLADNAFYPSDQTRALLLLSDGAYLEDQARAENLGGDQWGMMNEAGNYPGQPWMWLYTFWYQVKPFSTSGNADALVWGLMMVLTAGLVLIPFIPGLRSLPKHLGVHKLIWRDEDRFRRV